MVTPTIRRRRSESLSKEEWKRFKECYAGYALKADAEEAFGLSYQVLDSIKIKGSARPETIQKVRTVISGT